MKTTENKIIHLKINKIRKWLAMDVTMHKSAAKEDCSLKVITCRDILVSAVLQPIYK